jgi:hypothetical protein
MAEAMPLPNSISPSVAGVASSGSRLLSTFSPTMLYEDMPVEMTEARMMKKKED